MATICVFTAQIYVPKAAKKCVFTCVFSREYSSVMTVYETAMNVYSSRVSPSLRGLPVRNEL